MPKFPNPLAKSRSPADSELTQPRLLSSDNSDPGPSWPIRCAVKKFSH